MAGRVGRGGGESSAVLLTSRAQLPTLAQLYGRRAPGPQVFRGFIRSAHVGGPLPWDVLGAFAHRRIGMPTGTIARLLIDKGFGFIRDEGGIEHFFHRSAVRGAVFELLREGQRVEFTPEESTKGPRAGDVRLIES